MQILIFRYIDTYRTSLTATLSVITDERDVYYIIYLNFNTVNNALLHCTCMWLGTSYTDAQTLRYTHTHTHTHTNSFRYNFFVN